MPHLELPAKVADRGEHGEWIVNRARVEITRKYARAYARASKKDKGRMLDKVRAVTGWSREGARRLLRTVAKRPPGVGKPMPRARMRKSSYEERPGHYGV